MKSFLSKCLADGNVPFWNPTLSCGTPFLADVQSGVFYPPSLLFWLVPMPYALNLYIIVHYIIGAGSMYALCRHWGLSRPAACLSAISLSLGGYLVSMANVLNNLQAAVWLPTVFLALGNSRGRHSLFWYLVTSIVFTIQFLAGEPQILVLTAILAFIYHLVVVPHATTWPRHACRTLALFLAIGLGACAMAAAQLVPTLEMIGHSVRLKGLPFEEVAQFSFSPMAFLRLLLPPYFGLHKAGSNPDWLLSPYIGIVTLFFCIVSACRLQEKPVRFWGVSLLTGLVLAFGANTPFYWLCYKGLPFFSAVRFPEKFFFIVGYATSILAGFGFDAVREKTLSSKQYACTAIFLLAIILLGISIWIVAGGKALEETTVTPVYQTVAALLPLCLLAFLKGRLRKITFSVIIIVIAAADLIVGHMSLNPVAPYAFHEKQPNIIASLEKDWQQGRLFVNRPYMEAFWPRELSPFAKQTLWKHALFPAIASQYNMTYIDGIGGVETENQWFITELLGKLIPEKRMRLLQLAGVRYMVTTDRDQQTNPKLSENMAMLDNNFYQLTRTMPRAYMVSDIQTAQSRAKALETTLSETFDPANTVVVERDGQFGPMDGAGGVVHRFFYEGPNVIRATVESFGGCLIVSDAYYPGWKASVNGKERDLFRTNGLFMGLYLEPGTYDVALKFRPTGFIWALGVSCLTWIAAVTGLLACRFRWIGK